MRMLPLTSLGGDDFTASALYYLYMYMSLSTLMCLCLPLSLSLSLSLSVFAAAPVGPSDQAATYKLLKVMEEVSLSLMHAHTHTHSLSLSLPPSLHFHIHRFLYSTHLISIVIHVGFFCRIPV